MISTPQSKDELPFSDELDAAWSRFTLTRCRYELLPEQKPPSKMETVFFTAAWLIVLVGSVIALAGTAGFIYTRWLS